MSVGKCVVEWWLSSLSGDSGTSRAAKANLRRCSAPVDALAVSETHDLNLILQKGGYRATPDRLALIATIYSQLGGMNGEKLAGMFGRRPSKNGPRNLSELRFQSLIRIDSPRNLMVPLRRSLAVLATNPVCDGYALARDLFYWNDGVRNRWCFEYFGSEIEKSSDKEKLE